MDATVVYGAFGRTTPKILPFPRKGLPINIGSLRFMRLPVGVFVGKIKDGSVDSVSFNLSITRAPFEELVAAIAYLRQNPLNGICLFYNERYNIFYLAASKSYEKDILVCKISKRLPMVRETGLYLQVENLEGTCPELTLWAGLEGTFSRQGSLFSLFTPEPRDAA